MCVGMCGAVCMYVIVCMCMWYVCMHNSVQDGMKAMRAPESSTGSLDPDL